MRGRRSAAYNAAMRRLACLIALVLLTQGCGIRGPLYIETPEQKRKAEERRERREAAKQRDAARDGVPASSPGAARTLAPAPASRAADAAAVPAESADLPLTDEAFGPSSPPQ
jgi:predicted small lipoprotein YifL